MPAALFMTLVRTLIRAAAKENYSPAAILRQVNDLLVPDAKQGMFVTVLIAIIAPNESLLTYANAGHNPPILHRVNNNDLQELYPTGMALGVFEGLDITESSIQFNSKDRLIIYTDGVTEAFSPQEEIYGVDRLKSAILTCKPLPANGILDILEANLNNFINGASPSDDLTLGVLIRQ
jgi:sigma-B regulation protein RsbU (phosphoserine phosphatase)